MITSNINFSYFKRFFIIIFLFPGCNQNDDNKSQLIKTPKDGNIEISYHRNGKIKKIGLLVNNQKNNIWKTYDSTGKIISVAHFNNNKLLFQLPIEDFEFSEIKNDSKMISIKTPKKWISKIDESDFLLSCHKNCKSELFCPNIIIVKDDSQKLALKEYFTELKRYLTTKLNNSKIVTERELKINGYSAFQVCYLFEEKGNKLGGIITIINNKLDIYSITCTADNEPAGNFLRYKGLFEEISNSFKIYK